MGIIGGIISFGTANHYLAGSLGVPHADIFATYAAVKIGFPQDLIEVAPQCVLFTRPAVRTTLSFMRGNCFGYFFGIAHFDLLGCEGADSSLVWNCWAS
jgi:hypothetical protein